MKKTLAAVLTAAALMGAAPAVVMAQDLPTAEAPAHVFAPFLPLIGKTWRGRHATQEGVEDVMRWDWAVGGHAVRITHAVNGGVYGGETLIFPDKDSGQLIFHYFTTGGFHTTGVIRPTGPGAMEIEETVHGADGVEMLKSRATLGPDGVYRTRALVERDGQWVEFGGFDYSQDAAARISLPMAPGLEAAASAGALDLTRRIVATSGAAGEDSAGYLMVRNGSPVADELMDASCACADRVEFHRVVRTVSGGSMVDDPVWAVPGQGALEVRPGTNLHFMLINFDPAKAVDGRVRLTLTFRDAGMVQADFSLTSDSAGAWAAFD